MYNFQYANPTRVCFGEGQIAKLPELIPVGSRLLVLYGGGSIKQNGVYEQLTQALAGREWLEFPGIGANPQYDQLMEAVALVKRERIDFLLAVGGGSVVDGSKFVAAAACFEGRIPGRSCCTRPHQRSVAAGLRADPAGHRLGEQPGRRGEPRGGQALLHEPAGAAGVCGAGSHDHLQLAGAPGGQRGGGCLCPHHRAVPHLPGGGEVQDRLAEGLLQVLVDNGPRALAEPTNYQVRANLMWAASLALNGLIGRGVPQDWSTHAIGHQLTALHGLDHAQSLAVVLPSLLREQSAQKQEKLAQFAERVWHSSREDKALRIEEAIIRTEQFFQQMGVGTRLADYGLSESCIPGICSNLKRFGLTALGEQQDIDPDKVARILSHAL